MVKKFNEQFKVGQGGIAVVTADKTLKFSQDQLVLVDATAGPVTVTLPKAVGWGGKAYCVKKIDSSLNAVIIATSGSETIDGFATSTLNFENDNLEIVSDNENWVKRGASIATTGTGQFPIGVMYPYINFGGAQPRFYPIIGGFFAGGVDPSSQSIESTLGYSIAAAFVWSKIRLKIDVNGVFGTTTHTSRINEVDGNQSISVPAMSTGEFTDLSNSDVVSPGDEINMRYATASGVGIGTITSLSSVGSI